MDKNAGRPPQAFPRRILIATVGLVPQVVTETLFSLCRQQVPPFVPTEIHIITTGEGRRATESALLDLPRAQLGKFAAEFDLPSLRDALTPERIHVITDVAGNELSDITDISGNAETADLIIRVIGNLASDDEAALHVSIAGGRKTMGFLAGYALSIFGRTQDRLSHVLIRPRALEQHHDFFYPPKQPIPLFDKDGRKTSTAEAVIVLAEMPFLLLRDGLPAKLLDSTWSFTKTIENAQAALLPKELVVDMSNQHVSCHGVAFKLSAKPFAFLALMARKRMADPDGDGFVHWSNIGGDEYLAEYRHLPDARPDEIAELRDEFRKIGKPGYEGENDPRKTRFEQFKTRLNKQLARNLGAYSGPYEMQLRKAANAQNRWGLLLLASAIRFGRVDLSALDDNK
jgi:CRISPR-associated protein (TIGR02584 family)